MAILMVLAAALLIYFRGFHSEQRIAPQAQIAVSPVLPAVEGESPTAVVAAESKALAQPPSKPLLAPIKRIKQDWTPLNRYTSVSAALDDLLPAAEAGDSKAMLGIARVLSRCLDGGADPDNQSWFKAGLASVGYVLDDEQRRRIARKMAYCNLPISKVIPAYNKWLLQAADSGDSEAQLYAAISPPVARDLVSIVRQYGEQDEETINAVYNRELFGGERNVLSLKYAQLARDQGEFNALMILATAHGDDGIHAGDPLMRYENAWLMSQIREANGETPFTRWIDRGHRELLPIQLEQSESRAVAVINSVPVWTVRNSLPAESTEDLAGDPIPSP